MLLYAQQWICSLKLHFSALGSLLSAVAYLALNLKEKAVLNFIDIIRISQELVTCKSTIVLIDLADRELLSDNVFFGAMKGCVP